MFIQAVCLDLGFEEQLWFTDVEQEGRGEEMALLWVHKILILQPTALEQQTGAAWTDSPHPALSVNTGDISRGAHHPQIPHNSAGGDASQALLTWPTVAF